MTTPADPPPDSPAAYDPTDYLRGLYRQAEMAVLRLLAAAVDDTIANPASQPMVEARLKRDTRRLVQALDRAVSVEVDNILATADIDGEQRALDDE